MAKELKYLNSQDYEIYSADQIVRTDYCDNLPRIKKVYKNTKGYYIKGQVYWEPSSVYLRDYEDKLSEFRAKQRRGTSHDS
jgi:hypothetical protein